MLKPKTLKRKIITKPVNGRLFQKRLEQYLPKEDAEELSYHLGDIDDSCQHYRGCLWAVRRAMPQGKKKALNLDDAVSMLAGEIYHLRWHAARAFPQLLKLNKALKKYPPLNKMTDLQYTKRILAPSLKWLAEQNQLAKKNQRLQPSTKNKKKRKGLSKT